MGLLRAEQIRSRKLYSDHPGKSGSARHQRSVQFADTRDSLDITRGRYVQIAGVDRKQTSPDLMAKACKYKNSKTRQEDFVRRFLNILRDSEACFQIQYYKEPYNID